MHTVAVVNQKGGVGKTTTVCNLAAALGRRGQRVLAVDLDPQSHLGLHLGVDEAEADEATLYEVLVEGADLRDAVVATEEPGVSLLPGSIELAGAELRLADLRDREYRMRDAFRRARLAEHYDLVLIDCPPSLGLLSLNALCASDQLLVPMQAEFFALHGVARLLQVVGSLEERFGRGPKLLGVLLCRFQGHTRLAREVQSELGRHFGRDLLRTVIHQNVTVAEASSHGRSVVRHAPSSRGAEDYQALAREIGRRLDRQRKAGA